MVEEGEGRDGVSINQLTKGACSLMMPETVALAFQLWVCSLCWTGKHIWRKVTNT